MSTVHNPTNFNPADYEVEDYLDNVKPAYFGQGADEHQRETDWWRDEMVRTFGPNFHQKIHHCIHCGNGSVRWITAVRHKPTNEVVVFGAVCTKRLGFADRHSFKLAQLQARAEARKVKFTIWNERQAFLATHPSIVSALAVANDPAHAKNHFVHDVLAKLDRFGSLSDKQVAAVESSLKRDDFAARKALEDVEVKGDAPSGRVAVTGTVLSTKLQESDFGVSLKMLMKLDNNAKVWCTVPSKATVERGDRLTVRATWTPSRDDKHFAFGSRPTLVSQQQAAAQANVHDDAVKAAVNGF